MDVCECFSFVHVSKPSSATLYFHTGGKIQPSSCYLLLFFGAVTPFREPLGAKGNLKKSPKVEWEQAGMSWLWFPVTEFFCSLFP